MLLWAIHYVNLACSAMVKYRATFKNRSRENRLFFPREQVLIYGKKGGTFSMQHDVAMVALLIFRTALSHLG